jgi:hypothetical protein
VVILAVGARVGGICTNANRPTDFLDGNLVFQTNVIHSPPKSASASCCSWDRPAFYPRLVPPHSPRSVASQHGCDFISRQDVGPRPRPDVRREHTFVIAALNLAAFKLGGRGRRRPSRILAADRTAGADQRGPPQLPMLNPRANQGHAISHLTQRITGSVLRNAITAGSSACRFPRPSVATATMTSQRSLKAIDNTRSFIVPGWV